MTDVENKNEQLDIHAAIVEGMEEACGTAVQPLQVDEIYGYTAAEHDTGQPRASKPRLTPIQQRYTAQLRGLRTGNKELLAEMGKMLAWTFMPGTDKNSCPGISNLRSARMLVMDRYQSEYHPRNDDIALTMFSIAVDRMGRVFLASPRNVQMFKNFAIMPHAQAGGICLDDGNTRVFREALELDAAIEYAAGRVTDTVEEFAPPGILFGFPQDYEPLPEWFEPMQAEFLRVLSPSAAPLRSLTQHAGKVTDIHNKDNGFRVVELDNAGTTTKVYLPNWLRLLVKKGDIVDCGTPIADLQRRQYTSAGEAKQAIAPPVRDWIKRQILRSMTETIIVEENVYDPRTGKRNPQTNKYLCLPYQFVRHQYGRVKNCFLDTRNHLGRFNYGHDCSGERESSYDLSKVRIDVMRFDDRPSHETTYFSDNYDNYRAATYVADLMTLPSEKPWWLQGTKHRRHRVVDAFGNRNGDTSDGKEVEGTREEAHQETAP